MGNPRTQSAEISSRTLFDGGNEIEEPARSVVPPRRPGERGLEQRAHVPCRELRLADGDRGPAEEVERAHVRAEGDAELLLGRLDGRQLPERGATRGAESANSAGLLQRGVRALKSSLPGLLVITDVALDPYSSDGHDGVVIDQ